MHPGDTFAVALPPKYKPHLHVVIERGEHLYEIPETRQKGRVILAVWIGSSCGSGIRFGERDHEFLHHDSEADCKSLIELWVSDDGGTIRQIRHDVNGARTLSGSIEKGPIDEGGWMRYPKRRMGMLGRILIQGRRSPQAPPAIKEKMTKLARQYGFLPRA